MSSRAIAAAVAALGAGLAALAISGGQGELGAAAAARAPAKWKRVFVDDFSQGLDRSRWVVYSGQPGGDPGGWWDPSHATVRDGVLSLETYQDLRFGGRWVSGGVSSSRALRQRYGKYLVRFRMDAGRGVLGVLLLWPASNVWPPEIDFAETGGANDRRDEISATLHYGSDNSEIHRSVQGEFTQWHTAGVEWTPGRLVYTLDGRRWATVSSPYVPGMRMDLDIQAQAGTCGNPYSPCPGLGTPAHVNLQVDRVTAYRYIQPRR
jgi:beta-glucanase (GH16 family)